MLIKGLYWETLRVKLSKLEMAELEKSVVTQGVKPYSKVIDEDRLSLQLREKVFKILGIKPSNVIL